MKLREILALYILSVIVNGAWWAAAVQPVILSLGAVWAALDHEVLDIQAIGKNILPYRRAKPVEQSEKTEE